MLAINKIELARLHRQNTFVELAFCFASSEESNISSTRSLSSASTPGPISTSFCCSYAPTACAGGASGPRDASNRALSSSSNPPSSSTKPPSSSSSTVNCARLDIGLACAKVVSSQPSVRASACRSHASTSAARSRSDAIHTRWRRDSRRVDRGGRGVDRRGGTRRRGLP